MEKVANRKPELDETVVAIYDAQMTLYKKTRRELLPELEDSLGVDVFIDRDTDEIGLKVVGATGDRRVSPGSFTIGVGMPLQQLGKQKPAETTRFPARRDDENEMMWVDVSDLPDREDDA